MSASEGWTSPAQVERLKWSYADAIAEVEQQAAECDALRAKVARVEAECGKAWMDEYGDRVVFEDVIRAALTEPA